MAATFDPYHRWLAIPPEEQPADNYRLLGLAQFEDDPEVIRDAAERQIAHVRRYGLGKHAELSQRILNELAAAKGCLSDPERKSEYDRRLRQQAERANVVSPLPAAQPRPEPPAAAAIVSPPVPVPVVASEAGQPAAAAATGTWKSPLVLVGGACAGLLLVVVLVLVWRGRGDDPESSSRPGGPQVAGDPPRAPEPPEAKPSAGEKPKPEVRPPRLAAMEDKTVDEGARFSAGVRLSDPGSPARKVVFKLDPCPLGAGIYPNGTSPDEAVVVWDGTKAGGPHPFVVQAVSADTGEVLAKTSFAVTVREVNDPPVIGDIDVPKQIEPGEPLERQVRVAARNMARRRFVFELVGNSHGATIGATTGEFSWTPTEQQGGKPYQFTIRVTDDSPLRQHADTTFSVRVVAEPKPPPPPPESITLSMGRVVDLRSLDLRELVLRDALAATDLWWKSPALFPVMNQTTVVPQWNDLGSFTSWRAFWTCRGKNLEGVSLIFFEGKDPVTSLRGSVQEYKSQLAMSMVRNPVLVGPVPNPRPANFPAGNQPGMVPGASPAVVGPGMAAPSPAPKPVNFWTRVAVQGYLTYKRGSLNGPAATWQPNGHKELVGQYLNDQRDGLWWLFAGDQPRVVLVCSRGNVEAVHLVSGSVVAKTFDDLDAAAADRAAGPLLKEIDRIDSELKTEEKTMNAYLAQVRKFLASQHSVGSRAEAEERMRVRAAENARSMNEIMSKARSGGR